MPANNTLGELLTTIFDRRPFSRKVEDPRPLVSLCWALLAEKAEVSGLQLATAILDRYKELDRDQKISFFTFLNDELDLDTTKLADLTAAYSSAPSPENFAALSKSAESGRRGLLRRLNQAPGATAELVRMRKDLLSLLKTAPELARTDLDFVHLLRSWFNRGFLVLRQITWDSPAAILEKIIAYEAVHEIHTWADLRRRLHPIDRRCFAFFHPAMPHEPLIFVEVALTKGVPNSIQKVLSDDREELGETEIDSAVFYSISNCQDGLGGISFGNSLIKQVARDLSHEFSGLKTYVTLSPIPGFMKWVADQEMEQSELPRDNLEKLAAYFLLSGKTQSGKPLDPVARFHLGNGAQIHEVHGAADVSEKGMAQSGGVMVNYLYDLSKISKNLQLFASKNEIAASSSVKSKARQAVLNVGKSKA